MNHDASFNSTAWHDNHVHGLSVHEGEDRGGQLVLDLDHIVEWVKPKYGSFSFRIAPAFLTFHDVSDLEIFISYAASGAAIVPFSIGEIHRDLLSPGERPYYQWEIDLSWPKGKISFKASGFTQVLRTEPIESEGQKLSQEERQGLFASTNSPTSLRKPGAAQA